MSLLGRYIPVLEAGELPADVADWPDAAKDRLEERLAIMVVCGGVSAEEAPKAAEASVRDNYRSQAAWDLQHLEPLRPSRAAVACAVMDEAPAGALADTGQSGGGMVRLRAVGLLDPESSS